tara:strand:- start:89 stop:313 length:225 start_codon:yes stop_codon:yes gene_type:complete
MSLTLKRPKKTATLSGMNFFKAMGAMILMALGMGATLLILMKGSGFVSLVPLLICIVVSVYAFAKYGCLSEEEH